MAIHTVKSDRGTANRTVTIKKDTLNSLEDVSAALNVCETMILAADNFVDEVREYSAPGSEVSPPIKPDEHVFGSSLRTQTMLDEARDRLMEAKVQLDSAIREALASGQPPL